MISKTGSEPKGAGMGKAGRPGGSCPTPSFEPTGSSTSLASSQYS